MSNLTPAQIADAAVQHAIAQHALAEETLFKIREKNGPDSAKAQEAQADVEAWEQALTEARTALNEAVASEGVDRTAPAGVEAMNATILIEER